MDFVSRICSSREWGPNIYACSLDFLPVFDQNPYESEIQGRLGPAVGYGCYVWRTQIVGLLKIRSVGGIF